jgi:hypothetical protein
MKQSCWGDVPCFTDCIILAPGDGPFSPTCSDYDVFVMWVLVQDTWQKNHFHKVYKKALSDCSPYINSPYLPHCELFKEKETQYAISKMVFLVYEKVQYKT